MYRWSEIGEGGGALPVVILVVSRPISALLIVSRGIWRPQGEVVTQELHDQGRVFVAILVQCVQLGDGIVECLKKSPEK